VNRRRRHAAGKPLQPLVGGARHEHLVQQARKALAVGKARREAGEGGIGGPLRPADGLSERGPEFLLVAHDEDPPVAGAVKLARREAGVRRARAAAGDRAAVQEPRSRIAEVVQREVEQGSVEVHSVSRPARAQHAGEQRERRGQPGHEIDDR
jgi:hypothetical protein